MRRKLVLVVACLLMAGVMAAYADQTPRIAVISAFGAELEKLKGLAEVESTTEINGRSFTLAKLEGDEVVMFLCGVSMVNASMTTQLALDHFNVTHIVFSGIAGGVNPNLDIGDVVVPAKWGEYQEALFARKKGDGYDVGWHSKPFANFGMSFPQKVEVTRAGLGKPDATEEKFWFDVDPAMLKTAQEIEGKVALLSEAGDAKLSHTPKLVVGGNGVSGQTFVDNADYRRYAFATFKAECLDMETAAVAHVAYANGVPFLAFRSLSDLAGGGPGENEINTFFKLAANNAAEVLDEWFKAWK